MPGTESMLLGLPAHDVVTTAVVFVVTLVMLKLVMMMVQKKRYNLPPGPWGLPLVGYLPFFGPQPHLTFTEMRKLYGDVISIKMGSWPAIVVNGSDAIKEALVSKGNDFAGRPGFTASHLLGTGFTFLNFGTLFKMHRKIVSNVLYNFSNARQNPVEDIILSDAKVVIKEFLAHENKSFCPLIPLDIAGSSIIYQLCYGRHRNIRDDEDFIKFIKQLRDFTDFNRTGNPVDVMPWLRRVMPSKVSRFLKMIQDGKELRTKKVKEHESSFDESDLRDITDGLIYVGNKLSEVEKAVGLNKYQVIGNLSAIFGAASSTVSATLKWCVGLLTLFPEVQEEVFQQIDTVVGQGRDITLADRAQLPLVEATIYEVLRYAAVAPFTIPHATTCDTTLQGYDIPEGTLILVNLFSYFRDEKLWGDPNVFRPKRFLDSEDQLNKELVEQTPAFSLGRRRCVGEFLARMELFLFFATLVQHLKFFKPPGHPDIELKAPFSLTLDLEPFDVCVSLRE